MGFPRLKNALLCRILVYVVVIGAFIVPMIVVANLDFLPVNVRGFTCVGLAVALVVYILKNFLLLMEMDIELAMVHCRNTARKRFALRRFFSVKRAERAIARFGKAYSVLAISPKPSMLRYKSQAPITIHSSGIEKMISIYHSDLLDAEQYHAIVTSAGANVKALAGKKRHFLLDKQQRRSPLHRVSVVVIFAKQVEEAFEKDLFRIVCRNGGDGWERATLPCVVDLERRVATFDSERLPYVGFGYPVKNRGIRLVRKCLFGGRFSFSASPDTLEPLKNADPERTLWSFWRERANELIYKEKKDRKRHKKLLHKEIVCEDGQLYLKWNERGVSLAIHIKQAEKEVEIDAIEAWSYPKANKIAKDTVKEMKKMIGAYFAERGYQVRYIPKNGTSCKKE